MRECARTIKGTLTSCFQLRERYIDISSEWKKRQNSIKFFKKKSIIDHTQSTTCRWGEVKVKVSLWFYPRCCFIFFLSLSLSLTDCWLPISIFNRQQRCLLLSSCANINCAYLIIAVALCAVIMYFSSHFHALQSSSFIIIMLWLVNCFVIKCYLLHAIRTLIYICGLIKYVNIPCEMRTKWKIMIVSISFLD